jgi:hypothetical protein
MKVCGKSSLRNEWAAKVCGCAASASLRGTLKAFPASNASSFFARAKRSFRVAFARTDFFGFAFLERIELVRRRRLNCGLFFDIDGLF